MSLSGGSNQTPLPPCGNPAPSVSLPIHFSSLQSACSNARRTIQHHVKVALVTFSQCSSGESGKPNEQPAADPLHVWSHVPCNLVLRTTGLTKACAAACSALFRGHSQRHTWRSAVGSQALTIKRSEAADTAIQPLRPRGAHSATPTRAKAPSVIELSQCADAPHPFQY